MARSPANRCPAWHRQVGGNGIADRSFWQHFLAQQGRLLDPMRRQRRPPCRHVDDLQLRGV
jgi:hypothetical protein